MDWRKYLKTLGIDMDGKKNPPSSNEIKKAWRKKVHDTHPDKGGEKKEFMAVMHAYKMLTDSEYVFKYINEKQPNPAGRVFVINHVIDFAASFFGRTDKISYTRVDFDNNDQPMVRDSGEVDVVIMEIKIPKGCPNNHTINFEKMGHNYGEFIGDALVRIAVQPHNKYRLVKMDVHSTEEIPLKDMLKGLTVEVPTMYGLKTVKLKPGTVPGQEYEIPNCGVDKIGKHVVTIEPRFPNEAELKGDDWSGLEIEWEDYMEPEDEFMTQAHHLFESLSLDSDDDEDPFKPF